MNLKDVVTITINDPPVAQVKYAVVAMEDCPYTLIEIGEPGAGEGGTMGYRVISKHETFESAMRAVMGT